MKRRSLPFRNMKRPRGVELVRVFLMLCITIQLGDAFLLSGPSTLAPSKITTSSTTSTTRMDCVESNNKSHGSPVSDNNNNNNNNKSSTRWFGNYKPPISQLKDIPKAKKHTLHLTVVTNTTTTTTTTTGEKSERSSETKVLEKKKYESLQHVLVKAILWKLYNDDYPDIEIEQDIGDPNYLPDVVSRQDDKVLFWGESGRMSLEKAVCLSERYPETHIVWMRWGISIQDFSNQVAPALKSVDRGGRFTLAAIPRKEIWEFINEEETNNSNIIAIEKENVDWLEIDDYKSNN